jgi:hypothetical protein
MREQLYRMKHYPVQEQAPTRFCGATSTIMEVLDKSEKFQAFWRFTQREWKHLYDSEPEGQGAAGAIGGSPDQKDKSDAVGKS